MSSSQALTVDIEPTNRCNAKCYFCPRDATPHQGLMSPAVFEQALGRVVELRDRFAELGRPAPKVSLCGLGEPLLNRHTPAFVRRVREEDFSCTMSSNAALLDEARADALLEGGLQRICINVGDREADYDDVYKLPWEKTRDNVLRFRSHGEIVQSLDDSGFTVTQTTGYWDGRPFDENSPEMIFVAQRR